MGHRMSKPNMEATRETLIARRQDLIQRSEGILLEEQRLLEQARPDWHDATAALTAARLLDQEGDLEMKHLRRVQAALDRLDAGTYGHCSRCRQPIERQRLEAMPEMDRCASCCMAC
jgi:RNA polymerase-binding transcription factor DksA